MKTKFLLFVLASFSTICMYGQNNRVNFSLSEDFKFVRTDSEQNYYVFEYGSSLDAQDLSTLFYNKWNEVHNLPEYFDFPFRDSFFETDSGKLNGTTPTYSTILGTLALRYELSFKFKDGRVRIDSPSVVVLLRNTNVPHPEKTPSAWCHMSVGPFQKQATVEEQKRLFLEQITNGIINEFILFVEAEDPDWSNPHEYAGMDNQYFALGEKFKFVFPGEENRMAFGFPGASKEQLKEMVKKSLINMSDVGFNIQYNSDLYPNENAIYVWGREDIKYTSLLAPQKYTLHYRCYYLFEDDVIVVYVPKIYQVNTIIGDKPQQYNSLQEALWLMSVCKKDGTHNTSKNATAFIANLNKMMNSLVFAPLEVAKATLNKTEKQEEEW